MWTIYKLTCTRTGMPYVGLTRNTVGIRWAQHQSEAHRKRLPNHPLHVAICAEGAGAFLIETLAHAETRESAYRLETEMINRHGTLYPKGYNRNTGGFDGRPDYEVRRRQREAAIKRGPMSAAAIEKMRATKRSRPPTQAQLNNLKIGREKQWRHLGLVHLTPEERRRYDLAKKREWMRQYLARKAIAAGRIPGRVGRPDTRYQMELSL
jgi:hypothetical protein